MSTLLTRYRYNRHERPGTANKIKVEHAFERKKIDFGVAKSVIKHKTGRVDERDEDFQISNSELSRD